MVPRFYQAGLLTFLVFVVHSASASYKEKLKPLPSKCAVKHLVHYDDVVVTETEVVTVTRTQPLSRVDVRTKYLTNVLTENVEEYTTVTPQPQILTATEYIKVEEEIPLLVTSYAEVTAPLTETWVNVVTLTSTNYVTRINTIVSTSTIFRTVTVADDFLLQVPNTVTVTDLVYQTITQDKPVEEIVTELLPGLSSVATVTEFKQPVNTHRVTKIVVQPICPVAVEARKLLNGAVEAGKLLSLPKKILGLPKLW